MLADVDAGSHTPSMVGKVLAWRKTNPEKGLFFIQIYVPYTQTSYLILFD